MQKNSPMLKPANKTKISKQKTTKTRAFCAHNSKRVKVTCLRLLLFVRVRSFRKKTKINRFEVDLMASIDYTIGVLESIVGGAFFIKLFPKTSRTWILFKARKRIQVSGHILSKHILFFGVFLGHLNLKLF